MKCNRERALFQNEPTPFRTHLNPTAASLSRQGAKRRHAGLELQQTFWRRRIHAAARPAILLFLSLVRWGSHSRPEAGFLLARAPCRRFCLTEHCQGPRHSLGRQQKLPTLRQSGLKLKTQIRSGRRGTIIPSWLLFQGILQGTGSVWLSSDFCSTPSDSAIGRSLLPAIFYGLIRPGHSARSG